jgi:predicted porin
VKPLLFFTLSALAACGTGAATAQSVAAPEPGPGGTAPESLPATDAAEARRVIDDAALNQDPDAAERRIGSLFERHGEAQLPADESPLKLYGSLRIHAIRNGTEVSGEDQGSGFSLGDGGSRIGARLQHTFGQATAMFGRLEAGFNILDVFSSNASSGDDGEHRALNPRLYYVAFDSPYAYASYGKNWSTYYQVAGTTDRFATFGGDTSGVFNAGTDGGASGTGRADEVLQTRLYVDAFGKLPIKPFNLNMQYQHGQPIPLVEGADFGNQFGASARLETEAGWGLGVAYNQSQIDDLKSPQVVSAGLDGDDRALALSTSWSGEHWNASLVWSRQDNHATNDQNLYVDGRGVELYAQWEFHPRWWLVAGGNWFKADNQDPQAGRYEVDRKIIGLHRTIDSFHRMVYVEYQLNDGSGFDGDRSDDELALGIRWDFGYGKHRILEVYDTLLEKTKER